MDNDESSSITDHTRKEMVKAGVLFKEDTNSLLQGARDVAFGEILNHKSCGDSNCGICQMKMKIRDDAYEDGAKQGIIYGQNNPDFKVE